MDDRSSTTQNIASSAEEPELLDVVTAELRVEFARLNRIAEQAENDAEHWAEMGIVVLSGLQPTCLARRGVQCALLALSTLDHAVEVFGTSDFFVRRYRFWVAFLVYCLSVLAKLSSLHARSQRAFFRAPLFTDGPELSGYKHRLR